MTSAHLPSFAAPGGLVLLLAAQADQADARFRLYRSLGGGWNADPGPTDQLAAQP